MTAITTPTVHPESAADTNGESINLYRLGMLFVVRCRYWTCRSGNDADDLELSADRIAAMTPQEQAQPVRFVEPYDKDRVGYAVQLVRATEDIHVGERHGDELCVPAGEWMLR